MAQGGPMPSLQPSASLGSALYDMGTVKHEPAVKQESGLRAHSRQPTQPLDPQVRSCRSPVTAYRCARSLLAIALLLVPAADQLRHAQGC